MQTAWKFNVDSSLVDDFLQEQLNTVRKVIYMNGCAIMTIGDSANWPFSLASNDAAPPSSTCHVFCRCCLILLPRRDLRTCFACASTMNALSPQLTFLLSWQFAM
jgi:hypothetical protein